MIITLLKRSEWYKNREWAWNFIKDTGFHVNNREYHNISVVDLGLNELDTTGLIILTLFETEWVGAKLLIMKPYQFFPQHRHPPLRNEGFPGKTEVIRGYWGNFYLIVPGKKTSTLNVNPPLHRRKYIDIWHEIEINPGDQYIIPPNAWHWFQAGSKGAIVWSISSRVTDVQDQFRDPEVIRKTVIIEDEFSIKREDKIN